MCLMSSSASHSPKAVSLLKTATHTLATRKNLPGSVLQVSGLLSYFRGVFMCTILIFLTAVYTSYKVWDGLADLIFCRYFTVIFI